MGVCFNCGASCCTALTYCLSDIWVVKIYKVKCFILKGKWQSLLPLWYAISTYIQCYVVEASTSFPAAHLCSFSFSWHLCVTTQWVQQSANSCVHCFNSCFFQQLWKRENKTRKEVKSVLPSNKQLLTFASLCDSLSVVIDVVTSLNVLGKSQFCLNGWNPVITEGKHWMQDTSRMLEA